VGIAPLVAIACTQTTEGQIGGGVAIAALAAVILICAIGWVRATRRAGRLEGELIALRHTPTSPTNPGG